MKRNYRTAAQENITSTDEQLSKTPAAPGMFGQTTEQRWSQSVELYGRPHLRLRQVAALVNELQVTHLAPPVALVSKRPFQHP